MRRLLTLLPLLSLLPFLACTQGTLSQYYVLGELRVVDLEADQPEVAPGTTVTITPLLSDLLGNGRPLTYSVVACTDPGIGTGATPTCDGTPDETTLVPTGTAVTGLTGPTYTATGPSFTVTVPSPLLQNRSTVDQFNGVSYLVLYTVTAGGTGPSVTALKRIVVSNNPSKNNNPTFASGGGILANGTALTSLPAGAVNLTGNIASGAAETYTTLYPNGQTSTQTEDLVLSWFVSDGGLEYQKTATGENNSWSPPSTEPVGSQIVVVAVLRDQRGGTSHFVVAF